MTTALIAKGQKLAIAMNVMKNPDLKKIIFWTWNMIKEKILLRKGRKSLAINVLDLVESGLNFQF